MRQRPWALTAFAILMLLVAVSLPIQAGFLQSFSKVTRSLTWLNLAICISCISVAWAAVNAHWSIRLILPMTIGLVVLNNFWVGYVGLDFNVAQTSFASIGFVALNAILLEKDAFKVLRDPKLKWWRVAERRKVSVPIVLFPWKQGHSMRTSSFDLSESGVFVLGLAGHELNHLRLGERFQIRLQLNGPSVVTCTARLVRKSKGVGTYPPGVAFSFEGLAWEDKKQIQRFISPLRDRSMEQISA